MNVYSHFSQHFDHSTTFLRDASGNDLYTYGDLDARCAAYAHGFASAGLAPGDRVIIQTEKSAEFLFIYFACLRAGLIFLPLNTAYQDQELEYFVADAEPSLIVCDPSREAFFARLCNVRTLDALGTGSITDLTLAGAGTGANGDAYDCDDDTVAAILYTSGTTGKPKGAMISHGNLASNTDVLHAAWGWQKDDVMLHALPVFHVHGLFVGTNIPVRNSSPIVFLAKFDPDEVIGLLPAATVYMGVPTNYTRLLANPGLTSEQCRSMRLFTSGSAPLLSTTFDEFHERTGHTIVERYGMTETGMNTSNPLNDERKAGTVGPMLPGVDGRIVDDVGAPAASGATGSLEVRGANVFKGYWRLPEKTRDEFTDDGYFVTGDLATLDADGYVSIVGRSKDLIISGGLNVYPKEIESVIDDVEGVVESAVIGVPHPDFGEAVTAVVVRRDDALTDTAIIDHLKRTLANFKVAKRVYFVDELPRNAMGKVQKNLLRDQFGV
jgi:malonyl-CoA/methylmalonyl-CoA synthetase